MYSVCVTAAKLPRKIKTRDCLIKAFSILLGNPYLFTEICNKSLRLLLYNNETRSVNQYQNSKEGETWMIPLETAL